MGRHETRPSVKMAPPFTPNVGNLSSKFKRCTVSVVELTASVCAVQTVRQSVTRNAAS